jgi:hypothetical protein
MHDENGIHPGKWLRQQCYEKNTTGIGEHHLRIEPAAT